MRTPILLLVGLLGCSGPGAAELDLAGTKTVAESAMKLIVAGKVDAAFARLRSHWPLPANEFDTLVMKTIQQRNLVAPRFGKSLGYVLVKEEKVSDFIVRYTYAEKLENHVLRWQLTFYKPRSAWVINNLFWDDNIALLIE